MPSIENAIASQHIPGNGGHGHQSWHVDLHDLVDGRLPSLPSDGFGLPRKPEKALNEKHMGLALHKGAAVQLVMPGSERGFPMTDVIPDAPLSVTDALAAAAALSGGDAEGAWMVLEWGDQQYKLAPALLAGSWQYQPNITAMGESGHWAWQNEQLKLASAGDLAQLHGRGLHAVVDGAVTELVSDT